MTAPWRYYGCENSYFSAKVRPALRYKGLHFAELLPTPAAYRDVIRPRTGGLAYIPILVTPEGDTWQDTSEILDALERRVPEPPLYPPTPVQRVNRWDDPALASLRSDLVADLHDHQPPMRLPLRTVEAPV